MINQYIEIPIGQTYHQLSTKTSDIHNYSIFLDNNESIEVQLFHISLNDIVSLEVWNEINQRTTFYTDGGIQPLVYFYYSKIKGMHYLKVNFRDASKKSYKIHIEKYKQLSGIIIENTFITAKNGPYLIGPERLTIADKAILNVEAGTIINFRAGKTIEVFSEGRLNLIGEIQNPIMLLGLSNQSQESPESLFNSTYKDSITCKNVIFQYDNGNSHSFDKYNEITDFKGAVGLLPSKRPSKVREIYMEASPFILKFFGTTDKEYYLGADVENFINWLLLSKRISDEPCSMGKQSYWEFVNRNYFQDLIEADLLVKKGEDSNNPRVQALVEYLKLGKEWHTNHGFFKINDLVNYKQRYVQDFFICLNKMANHFWYSHNISVNHWDQQGRNIGLLRHEDKSEILFINAVFKRLSIFTNLPFKIPPFGRVVPPIGILGIAIFSGPFKYPLEYPVNHPTKHVSYDMGNQVLYILIGIVKLLFGKTNAIFTWWIPTPSDPVLTMYKEKKRILKFIKIMESNY